MPILPDRSDDHIFQVNLTESDIRLLYNAVVFYNEKRPISGDRPSNQQEPTVHLEHMKRILFAMIMESNFNSADTV